MLQAAHVHPNQPALIGGVPLAHVLKRGIQRSKLPHVDARVPRRALQAGNKAFNGRVPRPQSQAGNAYVQPVHAGPDRLPIAHFRHAAGAVTMQMHRNIQFGFQGQDQVVGGGRGHQTSHVFHMDQLGAHALLLLCVLHKLFDGVEGINIVLEAPLDLFTGLFYRAEGGFAVSQILQGVKYQKHIDAGPGGTFHEFLHDIVRIGMISHQVLPAQHHLERRVFHKTFEHPDPIPGIVLQIPHAYVKGGAAPHLHTVVAHLVHPLQKRDHVLGGHAGGEKRLLTITKFYTVELDRRAAGKGHAAACRFRGRGPGAFIGEKRSITLSVFGRLQRLDKAALLILAKTLH